MKLRYLLAGAVALLGFSMADAQSVSTSSVPHLEKRGKATQLIVDGRPFLMLAGELTNSASSSMEYMEPYWPKLAAANMNTILAAVTWELVEPEPGKFDFALVDGAIREARRNHLRLIFIWFGSWKNGESTYTPLWVKKNQKQYPLFLPESGQAITYLSVFKEANWKADANAFAALMRHIRQVDGEAHTVLILQR
jgi:beta-galactosidase GanA